MSFGWMLVKTVLAMSLIIGLAYVTIRFILPMFYGKRISSRSKIKIIDRVGLEPRRSLFIVQVGKKTALVGTGEQGVTKVMDLEEQDVS